MLSPSVRDSNVLLAAYILPPLLAYVTKAWIFLPLKKRAKVKKVLGLLFDLLNHHKG